MSFDFLKTAIEPLLSPEIYRTVLDAMTDQIKAIKMDRVAISFTPRGMSLMKPRPTRPLSVASSKANHTAVCRKR